MGRRSKTGFSRSAKFRRKHAKFRLKKATEPGNNESKTGNEEKTMNANEIKQAGLQSVELTEEELEEIAGGLSEAVLNEQMQLRGQNEKYYNKASLLANPGQVGQ